MEKRKRTQKSRYKHESTGDYCTCAAYVAEIMCKRNAERKNQGSLPYKFWNKKPWDWTFKKQMVAANKILKKKDITEQALVKAVHSDRFKSIFSLNHPNAIGIIRNCQLLLDEQTEKQQEIDVKKNASHQKKKYGKRNVLNTLRNLEDGKKSKED
jgi:hypothetical protein